LRFYQQLEAMGQAAVWSSGLLYLGVVGGYLDLGGNWSVSGFGLPKRLSAPNFFFWSLGLQAQSQATCRSGRFFGQVAISGRR